MDWHVLLSARARSSVAWFAPAELAALPRAALVVEDRYSQIFALTRVRPAAVADGLAEIQVRWPNVPIVFCETRKLSQEWVYRFLAAAHIWASADATVAGRAGDRAAGPVDARAAPQPSTTQIRTWARLNGIDVADRGRLRPR